MIQRLQVFWINPIPASPTGYVACLYGRYPDGSRWELSAASALDALHSGALSLYVIRDGAIHDIVVSQLHGTSYLKCTGDDEVPVRLLALPAFRPWRGYRYGAAAHNRFQP